MNLENIKELLNTKAYDFLRTDPHLKDRILFLCLGGSHSYGTNIETSDVDIRGVALDSETDLLGITNFEQRTDTDTDTVIYSLSKFITLVSNCNPNIIEMLFCKPEHYIYVSPLGQILLDNRHLFLTSRAYYTFGGYAHAQLNRLENALSRDEHCMTEEEIQEHIARSVKNCLQNCVDKLHFDEDTFNIYVDKYEDDYVDNDDAREGSYGLFCDVNLKKFSLADFRVVLSETSNVVADYKDGVGQRNKKKDDLHLNKHMMHLIRLYFMCNEILRDCDLHTYREKEHDLLMAIRNGEYRLVDENGNQTGVKQEFYDLLNELETEANDWKVKTKLPKMVDRKAIYDNVLKPIYSQVLFKENN